MNNSIFNREFSKYDRPEVEFLSTLDLKEICQYFFDLGTKVGQGEYKQQPALFERKPK